MHRRNPLPLTSLSGLAAWTLLAATLALLGPIPAFADDDGQPGYQAQIEQFFAGLDAGEYGEALAKLNSGNPWMAKQPNLEAMQQQFAGLKEALGALYGRELIAEQKISDSYVLLWYVVRFDRSPVSFYFKFYKPKDEWRFYSFEYKEDLSQVARDLAMRQLEAP